MTDTKKTTDKADLAKVAVRTTSAPTAINTTTTDKASTRTTEDNAVKTVRDDAKRLESDIKEAEAPELKTGRIVSSDERRLMSMVDEKTLSKEDKEALLLDGNIIRMVSFTTTYAVQAANDEAAIEAVKRDSSKFPFSEPTVTVQSRAAVGVGGFLTGEQYEKRAMERDKREVERKEREAHENAQARQASAGGLTHTHPAPVVTK